MYGYELASSLATNGVCRLYLVPDYVTSWFVYKLGTICSVPSRERTLNIFRFFVVRCPFAWFKPVLKTQQIAQFLDTHSEMMMDCVFIQVSRSTQLSLFYTNEL